MDKKAKDKFVCQICSKSFSKSLFFHKHFVSIHQFNASDVEKLKAKDPIKDCNNKLSFNGLRTHLASHHGIKSEMENFVFNNKAASTEEGTSCKDALIELNRSFSEKYQSQYYILKKKDKDMQRIERALKFENQNFDQTDGERLDIWVKSFCEAENSPILMYRPESHLSEKDSDFILVIMTEYQKHILLASANKLVCVDRIEQNYGSHHFVTVILVMDEHNMAFPVAFCISSKFDKCVLMQFFNAIKQNTGFLTTANFMSNEEEFFYDAWREVMESEPTWLWSTWSVDNSFKVKLYNELKSNTDARIDIYRRMRAVLECQDEERFQSVFEVFLKYFFGHGRLKQKENCIKKHYSPFVEKWAHCYQKNIVPETNMLLEILHCSLTFLTHEGLRKNGVVKYVFILMKLVRDKILDRLSKIDPDRLALALNNISWCHKAGLKIPIESVTTLSDKQWNIEISDEQFQIMLDSEFCPECCNLICNECNICVHMFTCTCYDNLINANICEHIHVVAFTSLDPKFTFPTLSLVNNETNVLEDTNMEKDYNTPENDDPASDIENAVPSDEYFYTALKKTHILFDTIKSKKTSLLTKSLQGVIRNLDECLEFCKDQVDLDYNSEFNDFSTEAAAANEIFGTNPISNVFLPLAPSINTAPFSEIIISRNTFIDADSFKQIDAIVNPMERKLLLKSGKHINETQLYASKVAEKNTKTSHLRQLADSNLLTNLNPAGAPLNVLRNSVIGENTGISISVPTAITGTGINTSLTTTTNVASDIATVSTNLKTVSALPSSMITSTNSTTATNTNGKTITDTVFMLAPVSTSSNVKNSSISGMVADTSSNNLTNTVFLLAPGSGTSNDNTSSEQVCITVTDIKPYNGTNSTTVNTMVGLTSPFNASTISKATTTATGNNLTNAVFVLAPENALSTVSRSIAATVTSTNASTIPTTLPGNNLNSIVFDSRTRSSIATEPITGTEKTVNVLPNVVSVDRAMPVNLNTNFALASPINTLTSSTPATSSVANNLTNTVFLLAPGSGISNGNTSSEQVCITVTDIKPYNGTNSTTVNSMVSLASPLNASTNSTVTSTETGNNLTNTVFLLAPGNALSTVSRSIAATDKSSNASTNSTIATNLPINNLNSIFVFDSGTMPSIASETITRTGGTPMYGKTDMTAMTDNNLNTVFLLAPGNTSSNIKATTGSITGTEKTPMNTSTSSASATSIVSNNLTNTVFILAPGNSSSTASIVGTTALRSETDLKNRSFVLAPESTSDVKTGPGPVNVTVTPINTMTVDGTKAENLQTVLAFSAPIKTSTNVATATSIRSDSLTNTFFAPGNTSDVKPSLTCTSINNLTNPLTVLAPPSPVTASSTVKTTETNAINTDLIATVSSIMTSKNIVIVSETEECAKISSTMYNEANVSTPIKLLRNKRGLSTSLHLPAKRISPSTKKNDSGIVITNVKRTARKTFSNLSRIKQKATTS